MKICYVLGYFYPHIGGAEQCFLDYILTLNKNKNIKIRVITSSVNGIVGHKKYNGIDIFYYKWPIFLGHPIVNSKNLETHIEWADLVHTAVYSPIFPVKKCCLKYKKPLIITVYEILSQKWFWIEKNIFKAILFFIYERFIIFVNKKSNFHTISLSTTNDLKKINCKLNVTMINCIVEKKEKKIISNKYKLSNKFSIPENNKTFLFYGRPGKTKGIFVYLDAIKKIKEDLANLKKINFCFIMSNDPIDQKRRFIFLTKKYRLENLIKVTDSVGREELESYISDADFIVIPSITEGFGLTAVEACEMGKKIICSDTGSLPEVVFGKVLFFENRNSNDLAKKIKLIINSKDKFTYRLKKDFSSKTIGKKLNNLYKKEIDNYEK